MPFFTKKPWVLLFLLFAILIQRDALAQCTFGRYPGAPYYCLGSSPIYCVEDTPYGTIHTPGWKPASWTVTPPPGDTVLGLNHSVTYSFAINKPGKYIVTMTDSVNGQLCSMADTFYVVPNPIAMGHLTETGHYCVPNSVCWIDSSSSPNSASLTYDFDWGNGVIDTSFCNSYDTPGVYYFLLTVTDSLGCYAMYSYQNDLKIGGAIMTMTNSATGACVCDSVTFTVSSWNTNVLTWISGGGSPDTIFNDTIVRGTSANPTVTTFTAQYCNTGPIRPIIIGYDDSVACSTADTLAVPFMIDSPLQQPAITESGYVLSATIFTADTVTYVWQWNGSTTADDTSSIVATQNGIYQVAISNACNSVLSDTVVVMGLGVKEVPSIADIAIRPNPATQYCSIIISSNKADSYDARLIDMTGKEISRLFEGRKATDSAFEFPVTSYDKGIYFLQFTDSEGRKTIKKLVIE